MLIDRTAWTILRDGHRALVGHTMVLVDLFYESGAIRVEYRITPPLPDGGHIPALATSWLAVLWAEDGSEFADMGGAFGTTGGATHGDISVAAPPTGKATIHLALFAREQHLQDDPDWILSVDLGEGASGA